MKSTTNRETFESHLTSVYEYLFTNDPEYDHFAQTTTASELAHTATEYLSKGRSLSDSKAYYLACRYCKILYSEMLDYLTS
jgi:hypothetical protein